MIFLIVKYYIYFFISTIITNLFGKLICNTFPYKLYNKKANYSTLFVEQFIGTLFIVVLFSIVKTSFHTIYIFVLTYPALLLYHNKSSKIKFNLFDNFSFNLLFNKLFILFPITLLVFLTQISLNYNQNLEFVFPHSDNWAYAKLSSIIGYTGLENWWHIGKIFLNPFSEPTPYHYFELWLTNFYAAIWGIPSIISFLIFTLSTFISVCFLGLLAILEKYDYVNKKIFFFTFICLFLNGVDWFFINSEYLSFSNFWLSSASLFNWAGRDAACIFMFSTFFFYLYLNNYRLEALSLLPILSIAHSGIFPSIGMFFVILFIINKINPKSFNKYIDINNWWFYYFIFIVLCFIIFYKDTLLISFFDRFGNSFDNSKSLSLLIIGLSENFESFSKLLYWFNTKIIGPNLKLLLFCSPWLFIISILRKQLIKVMGKDILFLFFAVITLLVCGSIMYGVTTKLHPVNAKDFFTITIPFLITLIIISLLVGIQTIKANRITSAILYIIIIFTLYNNFKAIYSYKTDSVLGIYDKEYVIEIDKIIHNLNPNITIASIRKLITEDSEDYINKRKLLEQKREYTLGGFDVEISTSPLLAVRGFQHELDLNCPPIYKQDAPSIFCEQAIFGPIDYNVDMDTYRERLLFLINNGLRIFISYKDSKFIVPEKWIEKMVVDRKSDEVFYLLKTLN